jgi:hypothetical protein
MLGSDGFFIRAENCAFLYDFRWSRAAARANASRKSAVDAIRQLEQQFAEANPVRRSLIRSEIRVRTRNLRSFIKRQNEVLERSSLATAIHEVVHQLVHNSNLLPRNTEVPTWIKEGISLLYEELADRSASQWKSTLGRRNRLRIDLLRLALKEKTHLVSTKRLIGTKGSLLEDGGAASYAKLWIAMHLLVGRPDGWEQLRRFIARLHAMVEPLEDDDELPNRKRREIFEEVFGMKVAELDAEIEKAARRICR